jgi:hypothetical protein
MSNEGDAVATDLCQEIECLEPPLAAESDNPLHAYCYEHAQKHGADLSGFKQPAHVIPEAVEEEPTVSSGPSVHAVATVLRPAAQENTLGAHSRRAREVIAVGSDGQVHKYPSVNRLAQAIGTGPSNITPFLRDGTSFRGFAMYYADAAPADLLKKAREGDVVLSTKPRGPRGPRLPAVLQPDAPVNSPAPAPSPATTIPPTTATAKLATTPKTTEMFVRDKAAIVDRREQIRGQIRELQMEDFQLGAVQDYIEEKLSGKE